MKKWIAIAVILICCVVYAIVKLSMSEYQTMSQDPNTTTQARQTPSARQTDAGSTDKATPERDSGSPDTAVQTDEATLEEDSGTPATAAQVEAITKVFGEFLSALESEDYEQAWKLVSESFKSKVSFEEFKVPFSNKVHFEQFKEVTSKIMAVLAETTMESTTDIDGRVRVRIKDPSGDGHVPFIHFVQEDGQWKVMLDM